MISLTRKGGSRLGGLNAPSGSSELGTGQTDVVSVTNTGASAFTRYVRVIRWSGGTGATNGRYTVNMNW